MGNNELFGKEHVERYRATDGKEGHDWRGTTALILTTVGRKSGEQRDTPLIPADGDDYVVVASKGGAPQHPALVPEPAGEPGDRGPGRGRPLQGACTDGVARREGAVVADDDQGLA